MNFLAQNPWSEKTGIRVAKFEYALLDRKRWPNHRNLPGSGRLLPVESITDLDHNKHGQGHRFGMRIFEYFTIDALKTLVLHKALHVMCLRKSTRHHRVV